MARYRKKIKWKNVLSGVLCLLLVVGAVMGITTLTGKDTKTIPSTAFSIGGIDDDGNYVKTDTSIYTKDMFECLGLTIEPDFEATGTYQVFYYGEDKAFLGSTPAMNAVDGIYSIDDAFSAARYARIMITPAVPVDEDGVEDEEFRIRFYEAASYARDFAITVNKDQKYKPQYRLLTFTTDNFKQANFTEDWSLETATTTLANRAVLNMYVPVKGTDCFIMLDDENFTYKYAVFKDAPVVGTRLAGTGFTSGTADLVHFVDDEATYYIAVGFEKADKSDFTEQDYIDLAKAFTICYNG